jgi:hypothetical protein
MTQLAKDAWYVPYLWAICWVLVLSTPLIWWWDEAASVFVTRVLPAVDAVFGTKFIERERLREEQQEREFMDRMAAQRPINDGTWRIALPPEPLPDMPISELFSLVDPDIFKDDDGDRVAAAGQKIRDALGFNRLKIWGRPLPSDATRYDPSKGPMPTPEQIWPSYWQKADFSCTFFDETRHFGVADTVITAATPLITQHVYFDLRVIRAEAVRIWPMTKAAADLAELKIIAVRFREKLAAQPPYPDAKAIFLSDEAEKIRERALADHTLEPYAKALWDSARALLGCYEALWGKEKVRKETPGSSSGDFKYEYEWRYTHDPVLFEQAVNLRAKLVESAADILNLRGN